MNKTKVKMNNPIYLGLLILKISKIVMHEFWNDYNFIEIVFRYGCSTVNLLRISRTPLIKNTSGWLLLYV